MKYNSSPNFPGIYEKKLVPYGLNDIRNFHKILIVEGHGCKHHLKLVNIDNVIAIGCADLAESTLEKLSSMGVTNITLLLDNDSVGIEKVKVLIKKYYGTTSIEFNVLDLSAVPDVKDPDELLRKYGIEEFNKLVERNAIEWYVRQEMSEHTDIYTAIQNVATLIAIEKSPVNRLRLISMISEITDVDMDSIRQEVEQRISVSKDRKSEYALKILEEAKDIITGNPDAIQSAMALIETKLSDFDKDGNSEESFSANECLRSIYDLKDRQESDVHNPILITGYHNFDKVCPLPISEAFILMPAPPNTLKTSCLLNLANSIVDNNDNTIVIMFTNDDSRNIYINRLVAQISKLKINWISNPKTYLDKDRLYQRDEAFKKVTNMILEEKLIIKDVGNGDSIEYLGRLIAFYRNKYPTKNIFVTCDNLSRISNEIGMEVGAPTTMKYISAQAKSYTTKYGCVLVATVELTKEGMFNKPVNTNALADTRALQFDANMVIYLWNEINTMRENANLVFGYKGVEFVPNIGYVQENKIGPIIEMIFLKNKVSEFKGSIYFNAYPELALFEEAETRVVEQMLADIEKKKEAEKQQSKENKKKYKQEYGSN